MALPKLNDVPKYEMKIPSTGKSVMFRPFLVKEQKVLLMALETQDKKQILNAITDTINVCVLDKIDVSRLATFDVEYMFMQLRAKSVGETADINLICSKCDTENEVKINLEDIDINLSDVEDKVKMNENYTIQMRYPRYDLMLEEDDNGNAAENLIKVVVACLDKLITEDEMINFDEETEEEVKTFVDNLTADQLQNIMAFINSIPNLERHVEFDCTECGEHNEITLKGVGDFF